MLQNRRIPLGWWCIFMVKTSTKKHNVLANPGWIQLILINPSILTSFKHGSQALNLHLPRWLFIGIYYQGAIDLQPTPWQKTYFLKGICVFFLIYIYIAELIDLLLQNYLFFFSEAFLKEFNHSWPTHPTPTHPGSPNPNRSQNLFRQ